MKTIVSEGKNVEKAIEAGLKELGVSQEEVSIKILSEGGFLKKATFFLFSFFLCSYTALSPHTFVTCL